MPERLTSRLLQTLKPPAKGRVELTDNVARGLVYRLTSSGSASWSLSMRASGVQRRFSIGEYPATSLADARVAAGKLRAEILAGADPTKTKREERARREAEADLTIEAVLRHYSSQHLSTLRDGKRREAQLRSALKSRLPQPIRSLKRVDLQSAIDTKARTAPVAANRLKAALIHFAGWARKRGYIEDSITNDIDAPTRERPRDRVLTLDEIGAIWKATLRLDPLFGSLVRLLILTAQRRGDVACMTWDELKNGRWEISGNRTKNGRPHIVHLSTAAVEDLQALKADADPAHDFVFTTTGRTPVSGFGRVKNRLDTLSGVSDWRLHDLRTAFATHCAEAGVAEGVVDRVLNHSASASTASAVARVYQRSALLPHRAHALDFWADAVLGAGGENHQQSLDTRILRLRSA